LVQYLVESRIRINVRIIEQLQYLSVQVLPAIHILLSSYQPFEHMRHLFLLGLLLFDGFLVGDLHCLLFLIEHLVLLV
jgi:hypothetical protein